MISKEKMDYAVKQVVENCLKVKSGEKVCVITDNETKHIGLAIAERMKQVAGNSKVFLLEDFGERPEDGSNPLKFPNEIGDFLAGANVSIYAAQGKKGEASSFRFPMLGHINKNKDLRHGHMINISDEIMETGMASDYKLIQEITKKIFDMVTMAKRIRVTTNKGMDITAEFNPSWKWIVCDGDIKKGNWSNLPDGEVFTCPKTVNGKVVADGVLGDYFANKGVIDKTPLVFDIKDGFVKDVSCSDKELETEINKYIKQEENANRIGEFAIGTNIGLKRLIGNLLQDEKFPGVHIAVGHTYPDKTGADWNANVHLDMVIQNTTIEVDGKTIMKDGKFLL